MNFSPSTEEAACPKCKRKAWETETGVGIRIVRCGYCGFGPFERLTEIFSAEPNCREMLAQARSSVEHQRDHMRAIGMVETANLLTRRLAEIDAYLITPEAL